MHSTEMHSNRYSTYQSFLWFFFSFVKLEKTIMLPWGTFLSTQKTKKKKKSKKRSIEYFEELYKTTYGVGGVIYTYHLNRAFAT